MTKTEINKIWVSAKAMSREEAVIILAAMPIDLLWAEMERKITKLCDFKDKFEALSQAKDRCDGFNEEELDAYVKRES